MLHYINTGLPSQKRSVKKITVTTRMCYFYLAQSIIFFAKFL